METENEWPTNIKQTEHKQTANQPAKTLNSEKFWKNRVFQIKFK